MASGIHPVINVNNVEKSIEFYKGIGLRAKLVKEDGMTWGVVTTGDARLGLFPKNQKPEMQQPADTDQWLMGEMGKGVVMMIGVGDARKNWEKANAIKADVDEPLHDNPWGGRGFRVVDPDGYLVGVFDKFPPSG